MTLVGVGLGTLWINTTDPTCSQCIFPEARYSCEDTAGCNKATRLMGLQSKGGSGVLQRFRAEALLQGRQGGSSGESVMLSTQGLMGLHVTPLKSMRTKHTLCSAEMGLLMRLKLNMWLSALLNQGQRDGKWALPVLILPHRLFHTAASWRLLTLW